jgi:carbon storage regulator
MLVISRKLNETIVIGEGDNRIEVMVTELRGDRVKLGVHAPLEVRIMREELLTAADQ